MTITVNGPSGVTVNFPDGTDASTIEGVMSQAVGGGQANVAPPGPIAKALEPITSYPAAYSQMQREARGAMAEGAGRAMAPDAGLLERAKGAGLAGLGAISFVASPINAALRTVVGKPLEENVGIPKEYSEFAAGLALPGLGLTKMPAVVQAAPKAAAPTVGQLKASYVAAKESPVVAAVEIRPDAMVRASDNIVAELNKEWLDPVLAPKTHRILAMLTEPPSGSVVTMANVDSARRRLGDLIGSGGEESAAAKIAQRAIDKMVGKITPGDVIAGDPAAAQTIMQSGRADYTAAKLAENLDKRVVKAELQTGATHSGMNLQNQLRQKVNQFLSSNDSRALTVAERSDLEKFVQGTATQNALRFIGKKLGNVFTTGAGATAGGLLGGIPGAAIGMGIGGVGYGLQKVSNMMTARQADQLSELLRSRSPLARRVGTSLDRWEHQAVAAESGVAPKVAAGLAVQSKMLAESLKDAGINIRPEDLMRGAFPASGER